MQGKGSLRVGTSGWEYADWRGRVYPEDLPRKEWLRAYADAFDTVEVNNTFYRLPETQTFDRWRDQAPPRFRYALKFSRYGTHMKKLRDPAKTLAAFLERAGRLGSHLGPILLQLPPHWHADPRRLEAFLREAPRRHRWAVEVRDPSWLADDVFDVLARHGAALVLHDRLEDRPDRLTADWTYLRFHGPGGGSDEAYPHQTLVGRARKVRAWLDAGRDVYAYFNNDHAGHAFHDAKRFRKCVEG